MGIRRKHLNEDSRIMINGDDNDEPVPSSSSSSSVDAKPGKVTIKMGKCDEIEGNCVDISI